MAGFESLPSLSMPDGFIEPFSGELHDTHYGPIPSLFNNIKTRKREAKNQRRLHKLFDQPPAELEIPDTFRRYLIEDRDVANSLRYIKSHTQYDLWRRSNSEIPPHLAEIDERYTNGTASIDEIVQFVTETTMPAFKVAMLTHPYGMRMEWLEPMRTDLADSITSYGGKVYERSNPYRSIKIIPYVESQETNGIEPAKIIGLTVKYKRDFGIISLNNEMDEEIHFVERQVAGYRIDAASGFPQDIMERMQDTSLLGLSDAERETFSWSNLRDPRHERLMDSSGCREFIEATVQSNVLEPFVVPIETIEYGYRRKRKTLDALSSAALTDQIRIAQ